MKGVSPFTGKKRFKLVLCAGFQWLGLGQAVLPGRAYAFFKHQINVNKSSHHSSKFQTSLKIMDASKEYIAITVNAETIIEKNTDVSAYLYDKHLN